MTYENHYHIICTPKYRKKAITEDVWTKFVEIVSHVISKRGETLVAIGGDVDHVHILVKTTEIVKCRSSIFSATSRNLRNDFPHLMDINEKSFWSKSFPTEIKDESHLQNTIIYINQKQKYQCTL